MKRVTTFWVWASIVLPALFGLGMFANPAMVAAANTSTGLVWMIAIRQVVFSLVLLAVWLRGGPVAAGYVVLGRGATDLLDGVSMMVLARAVVGPATMPIGLSVWSFVVGAALLRSAAPADARSPTAG